MGAATALMFTGSPGRHKILLTIADSSYHNLRDLLEEIGCQKMGIPTFILKPLIYAFDKSITKAAGFNIDDINVGNFVKEAQSPVVFIASKCDSTVPIAHTERLYKEYKGAVKELFYIEQDHQN